MSEESKVNFTVHNIYVKDVSFEAPNAPKIFTLEWKPKLEFDIQMARTPMEDNLYEVVMDITVSVTIEPGDDKKDKKDKKEEKQTAFICEVKQAGIFLLEGSTDEKQTDYILSTTAPTILFPYAREVISSMVTKGGFPQLIIPPMNFEAMYQQHLEEQKKSSSAANA